jgi:TRAP-type transport system periplasmic protein
MGFTLSHASFRPSRRSFAIGSVAALSGIAAVKGRAKAAQFEFKCGSNAAPAHPIAIYPTQMWPALERESGGRIHVQYFPNSQLGGDAAMFTQLREGAIQLFLISPANLAAVIPVGGISNLGFAYNDADQAAHVMDGPLGAYIRAETAAQGLYLFRSQWGSGMKELTSSSHPVRRPEDLHGFRLRSEGRIEIDLFRTLGASPTTLSAGEMYTSLQTKIIDGIGAPLVAIEAFKAYEVQKYISLTHHIWSGVWLIANGDAWKSLPPDLQQTFERVNTRYAGIERGASKTLTAAMADKLVSQGMTINSVDQAPFRRLLGSYYDSFAAEFGPTAWSLLQSSLGRKLA